MQQLPPLLGHMSSPAFVFSHTYNSSKKGLTLCLGWG